MTEPTQSTEMPTDLPAGFMPEGHASIEAYHASLDAPAGAPAPAAPAAAASSPVRPDYVPEQFWDASKGEANLQAWAKSHKELQAQFTKTRQQEAKDPAKPESLEIDRDEPEAPAADATAFQTVFDAFAGKWEAGSLEDADYEAVTNLGIPRVFLDRYLAGVEAQTRVSQLEEATARQSAAAMAGGEDTLNAALAWASKEMSEKDFDDYNFAVKNGRVAMGIDLLMNRYNASGAGAATSSEGKLLEPSMATGGGDYYRSDAEMDAAFSDARYGQMDAIGEAYRQEVQAKMARSLKAQSHRAG
ncbi:MAG: hypothetical protein ACK4UQ_06585 [Brevundimonas sp.]